MSQLETALIYDPICLEHDTGGAHVERPQRLAAILDALTRYHLAEAGDYLAPPDATIEQLARVHDADYIRQVESISGMGGRWMDIDTVISPHSWAAALKAAGAAVLGVDLLLSGARQTAFAIARPPGHHANANHAGGFCIFNNAAVAAAHALANGIERVLIVDWDVHHGNGTQDIFYRDPRVLYFSAHEYPFYPGSGGMHERGSGAGRGYTLNIPLPHGVGDDGYLQVWRDILAPAATRYRPQLVIISAGYDAHRADPIAYMNLTARGYHQLASIVREIDAQHCDGRVLAVLEGGYNLSALGDSVAATLFALNGLPLPKAIDEQRNIDEERFVPVWAAEAPNIDQLVAEVERLHGLK
ncbi:MAG: histone deacetylase [Candidatus Chloroheliales bacterium]|nr:MAG: histone deacetylase [Chloroflexota bacterium]